MKTKKLSALILCFTMLLSMSFSAEVYAHEEGIMRTENYQKTRRLLTVAIFMISACTPWKMPSALLVGKTRILQICAASHKPWPLWLS